MWRRFTLVWLLEVMNYDVLEVTARIDKLKGDLDEEVAKQKGQFQHVRNAVQGKFYHNFTPL